MRHLRVVWRAERGQVVAYLHGDLDADARASFDAMRTVAELERGPLMVDLSELRFIDPSGLRLLEELVDTGSVLLRDPSASVRRLVALVGDPDLLPIID